MIRRTLCLIIALLLTLSSAAALAQQTAADRDTEIRDYIREIYAQSLEWAELDSFQGYCGICVGCQMYFIGIHYGSNCDDGNAAYENLLYEKKPREGWDFQAFPCENMKGSYTLESICREINDTNEDRDYTFTVFCFHTGRNDPWGMRFGHALLVYAIFDDTVYWTETASGEPLVASIADFCARYAENEDGAYIPDGAVRYLRTEEAPLNEM